MPQYNDADEIRILVATDNHLGYLEKDPIRGKDSFNAFEEIFQLAAIKKADFILLGGDIFHFNQPTRACMYKTMNIIRKYCFGSRKSLIEYKSDPTLNFSSDINNVNFLNPNLNISMPVFTIHGNHDDPSGDGNLSAIDILAEAGLVNYFGKTKNVDKITLDPILLEKNNTKVAIYGIGSIRDERLYRTMATRNLKMNRPDKNKDDYFNIMTIHQNRFPHGRTNFIPEDFLEDFLDVVIWGHEHECLIDPQYNPSKNFHVIQPGSSVATSLSQSETKNKYVCLLKITGKRFELEKLRLQNIRPFSMTTVALSQVPELNRFSTEQNVIKYLTKILNQELKLAQKKYLDQLQEKVDGVTNFLGNNPKPTIRIRVDFSGGFEPFFAHKFGIYFMETIANPKDILLFYKRQKTKTLGADEDNEINNEENINDINPSSGSAKAKMSQMVESFIKAQDLKVFVDLELHNSIKQFVEKGDNNAIGSFVQSFLNESNKELKTYSPNSLQEISELAREVQLKRRNRVIKQFGFDSESEDEKLQDIDEKLDLKKEIIQSANNSSQDEFNANSYKKTVIKKEKNRNLNKSTTKYSTYKSPTSEDMGISQDDSDSFNQNHKNTMQVKSESDDNNDSEFSTVNFKAGKLKKNEPIADDTNVIKTRARATSNTNSGGNGIIKAEYNSRSKEIKNSQESLFEDKVPGLYNYFKSTVKNESDLSESIVIDETSSEDEPMLNTKHQKQNHSGLEDSDTVLLNPGFKRAAKQDSLLVKEHKITRSKKAISTSGKVANVTDSQVKYKHKSRNATRKNETAFIDNDSDDDEDENSYARFSSTRRL
ncbi:hypothetical protein BB561_003536 [Smittium simulii]|uniref:Mre11 DNA-binding domain-containing protein n=1 Tax=Smittium simulii TaxID=133385 RepID=A0A2T9YKR7_9FUNG|nr:hypothetical protein BB561_003536 [Smittium simulii]